MLSSLFLSRSLLCSSEYFMNELDGIDVNDLATIFTIYMKVTSFPNCRSHKSFLLWNIICIVCMKGTIFLLLPCGLFFSWVDGKVKLGILFFFSFFGKGFWKAFFLKIIVLF